MKSILIMLLTFMAINAQAMNESESFKKIQSQLNNSNSAEVSVIVELEQDKGLNFGQAEQLNRIASYKAGLMQNLSRLGVREHKAYSHLPMMALRINQAGLKTLENTPGVRKVYPNQLRRHTLNKSTKQIQADQARLRGWSGRGVVVAVLDTGVANFVDMLDRKVVAEACFTTQIRISGVQLYGNCWPNNSQSSFGPDASNPDCNPCAEGAGHGTSVSGIAIGNARSYTPIYKGVAIESDLIALNVFSRVENTNFCGAFGNGSVCLIALDSDILAGLNYVYALRDQFEIAAVNLSLGSGAFQTACDNSSVYTSIFNTFHAADIAVIASAGNEGSGTAINEPACVSKAIAVGSVGDTNLVSYFTNSNALIDFWAPGESITTSGNDYLNHYVTVSGTSFSAAHVSGAFAILKSYNKKLTVDEIESILKSSGLQIVDPLNGLSRPLIQINNALDFAPRDLGIIPLIYLLLLQ